VDYPAADVSSIDAAGISGKERWRRRAPFVVAAAFTASGFVHLVHPATFTRIVPTFLPAKTALVYASGVAELVCAVGLWRRDRWAGLAAAALLLAIWPANLQMAINAQRGDVLATKVEDWIRLPLQIPLIWCALQSGCRRAVHEAERTQTAT
jgi:uncharacterized membrane protein